MKRISILSMTLLFMFLFSCTTFASDQDWQLAYKDNIASFYFDTNTVKNVGSANVISADIKTELSDSMLQALIDKYKDTYDTSTWSQIKYSISYALYTQADKTIIIKNNRFYDSNNTLIVTISEENKTIASPDSVQSKICANIIEWQYEH